MGKAWDSRHQHEPWAREALRVAKPGAYLLAFGGTRTYHRLACAIEDAGCAEQEGFAWVGIEREAEYVAIAEARLAGVQRGLAL